MRGIIISLVFIILIESAEMIAIPPECTRILSQERESQLLFWCLLLLFHWLRSTTYFGYSYYCTAPEFRQSLAIAR